MKEKIKVDNEKADLKATMSSLFKTEEIELSQEDAIRNYKGENSIKKKKSGDTSDDETAYNEELEHLERIKKELLASLERVRKLEEKIFKESKKEKEIEKLKVKNSSASGGVSKGNKNEKSQSQNLKIEKENSERTRE